MTDKNKLIQSMANLIQHVSSSHKNQEEIFATLSITDINKILSNLDDTNQRLRKTTLLLLAELLFDNVPLQRRFCELTAIPDFTGKIVLTRNFPKNILNDHQSLQQITKILKEDSVLKQKGLFWYIDSLSKPKIIQIGKRNSNITIDPLNCIVGVWVLEQDNSISNTRDTKGSTSVLDKNDRQQRQDKDKQEKVEKVYTNTNNLYLPIPKYQYKNINPVTGKVRLNRSQHIDKYQQHLFKPETPLKGSLTQDQNGFITTRARDNRSYAWVAQTPTLSRPETKPTANSETLRYTANTTDTKNYQPITTTFDTMRYIKNNNYIANNNNHSMKIGPATTTHRMEHRGVEQGQSGRNEVEGNINIGQYGHTNNISIHYGGNMQGQDQIGYYYRKN